MKFIVGKDILIKDYTSQVLTLLNRHCVLDNPDYLKKERLGYSTWNTPRKLILFERIGTDIRCPYGLLDILQHNFGDWYDFEYTYPKQEKLNFNSTIKLYDYQQKACSAGLKYKNGIIVMPCGSGKTQTMLELISEIGNKTLWLTHTKDLLTQSKKRAIDNLNLKSHQIGTITEGKVSIGTHITFATVQTMSKLDLRKYESEWNTIVVDEAHHCIGSPTKVMMFYKVLTALNARYKFGLTATKTRNDGLEDSMFALIGDVIHETPQSEVKTCPIAVFVKETGFEIKNKREYTDVDGTIIYNKLIDVTIKNEERNKFIVDDITNNMNGLTLVLSTRIEHLKILMSMIPNSVMLTQSTKSADREKIFTDFKLGNFKVLLATYQLAKEGLDIPELRNVVFAVPQKDLITIQQAAGRVGRTAPNKTVGIVRDYIDSVSYYVRSYGIRKRLYKKLDYTLNN